MAGGHISTVEYIKGSSTDYYMNDKSKAPYKASMYADMRGVVDYGNLFQFAPFESGYCFLAVINAPYFANDIGTKTEFYLLQEAFVQILEQEFKGLSGIEDISAETMDIQGDGVNTLSLLGKVSGNYNTQISMSFTEKTGTPITKYITSYLKYLRDPMTQAKTYGGKIDASNKHLAGYHKEVFNMLYIVTDSTCFNVEKAFLILNAQPMSASLSELYNVDKGQISTKDVTVNFNAFVVEGKQANKVANTYLEKLIGTKIKLNSYNYNWSVSGINGGVTKKAMKNLYLDPSTGRFYDNSNMTSGTGYVKAIDGSSAGAGIGADDSDD